MEQQQETRIAEDRLARRNRETQQHEDAGDWRWRRAIPQWPAGYDARRDPVEREWLCRRLRENAVGGTSSALREW